MAAKDVKEITYMPLVTFFSVLERPGKNRKGSCNNPPLVRRGISTCTPQQIQSAFALKRYEQHNKMVLEPNVSPHKQIIKDDDVKECISIE